MIKIIIFKYSHENGCSTRFWYTDSEVRAVASSKRIFCVEDNPALANLLSDLLKERGYETCGSAANADEAVAGIERTRPDMVLVDIMLQGSNGGIAVGTYLANRTDIPFIYMTGLDTPDILKAARRTLPDGFLRKPFDDRQLTAAIEMAQRVG